MLATRMSPPVQRARSASVAVCVARPSLDHLEFAAWMIERVHDRQQIDRHVDGARNPGHFSRSHPAAGVDAVGDHQQRAMAGWRVGSPSVAASAIAS